MRCKAIRRVAFISVNTCTSLPLNLLLLRPLSRLMVELLIPILQACKGYATKRKEIKNTAISAAFGCEEDN